MRPYYKITLGVLAAATLFSVSCKKNSATTNKTDNSQAVAKQVALSLYKSLSSGVTSTTVGAKVNGALSLKTLDVNAAPTCGTVVNIPFSSTTVAHDTTRTFTENRIFTYMCNGYFSNNKDIDAYTLLDTLTSTEQGTAFKNTYKVTINYIVKSVFPDYSAVSVNGTSSASGFTSKLNGSTVTESHLLKTDYTWNWVIADRTGANPVFTQGYVDFTTNTTDMDGTTPPAGNSDSYTGRITFESGTSWLVDFHWGNIYHTFRMNITTGVITQVS